MVRVDCRLRGKAKAPSKISQSSITFYPITVSAQKLEVRQMIRTSLTLCDYVIHFQMAHLEVVTASVAMPALLSVQLLLVLDAVVPR